MRQACALGWLPAHGLTAGTSPTHGLSAAVPLPALPHGPPHGRREALRPSPWLSAPSSGKQKPRP